MKAFYLNYKILGYVNSPSELAKLNTEQLETLCEEARDKIINTVSQNGGHLASNLGAVELTVAVDRVFCGENDDVIFDVGHQCYTHKLLTGRFDRFDTLRQSGGISGFMRPEESSFDPVVTGHSSSSVSAAYGLAKSKELQGKNGYTVAVLGDGALTGGMVYEAFNGIGKDTSKLIIVINDNKMSISKNVGSLSRHLTRIRLDPKYHKLKRNTEKILFRIPIVGRPLHNFIFNTKKLFKRFYYGYNIFESLGLSYLGPVDGHNLKSLEEALLAAKGLGVPAVVHIITKKGKGYYPAEQNPGLYHGVSPFNVTTGVSEASESFSSVFGESICRAAENDSAVCAVTAAMADGTGLHEFSEKFKKRFFDVGIAEEHAVTFAAGLAAGGMKPVFAVYSSFLQRGYDQIIHDAAIAGLPVTFAVDRAGVVGDDGETHQGVFDIPFLTSVPDVAICSPSCYDDLRFALKKRLASPEGVAAIRYPRGAEPKLPSFYRTTGNDFDIFGTSKTALVSFGTLISEAFAAADKLKENGEDITVVKLNKIFPFDDRLIKELSEFERIYIYEESERSGGIGEKLAARLSENGYKGYLSINAINGFAAQGKSSEILKRYGLDADSIVAKIKREVAGIER